MVTGLVSYELMPEPTHMNAPDAWSVRRTVRDGIDEDGETLLYMEMLSHGTSFGVALDQIRMDYEQ